MAGNSSMADDSCAADALAQQVRAELQRALDDVLPTYKYAPISNVFLTSEGNLPLSVLYIRGLQRNKYQQWHHDL